MTLKPILALGSFLCLAIYLFVSAPPPLPGQAAARQTDRALPVRHLFDAVNAINDAAREVYTTRIVGSGLKAGLAFGEDWAAPGVDKGPLPALFLRLAAARMEAKPPQLGLYLGSDAPINPSNLFAGAQAAAFAQVRASGGPVFSTSERGDVVGMYPDVASAAPCVTCHNDHPDSPRKDWVLNEVMGATTWTYPEATVSAGAYLAVTEAFYLSVAEGYQGYLDKAAGFAEPITAGRDWPQVGRPALPDLATFMTEVRNKAGGAVMRALVLTQQETAS
ncbi:MULTISPECIES: c-type heme family protein [unclassified Marinovum]